VGVCEEEQRFLDFGTWRPHDDLYRRAESYLFNSVQPDARH
jgi:hypothetical protein